MSPFIIIVITIGLVALALLGLALRIVLKKGGKFPNTHVGGNKHLRDQGITCIQTYDKEEQGKARKQVNYKRVKMSK